MTWLMAIVGVLVLGGVAMLASGRAGSMPPAYDDRRDARIPDGPITPETLRGVRFTLAFRGYRMSEVDELLGRLAAQLQAEQETPVEQPDEQPREQPGAAEAVEADTTRPRVDAPANPE